MSPVRPKWVLVVAFAVVLTAGGLGAAVQGHVLSVPEPVGSVDTGPSAIAPSAPPSPFPTNMSASIVLGQPDFSSNSPGPFAGANASNFGDPGYAMAFDAQGDLWVTDWNYNRVVEFVPPFTNGMDASLVLGQSSFSGTQAGTTATNLSEPDGLAFDASGNLWVAEYGNNRVLEFPYPLSTGEAATTVIGQSTFTTWTSAAGPAGLNAPAMLTFHGGNLWVADYDNHRVLEYQGPAFTSGMNATLVIGQQNFTGDLNGTTAVNLTNPGTVAFDANGNLWVADAGNDRAVEFPAPFSTGEAATVVLGQANLTTTTTPGNGTFFDDNGISVDSRGNLWVADSINNRVLEFQGPTFVSNQTPAVVLGQANLSDTTVRSGPSGLSYPTLAIEGPQGRLWIDDESNYRVLGYTPTQYPVTFVESGLANGTNWSVTLGDAPQYSNASSIVFTQMNGSYTYTVAPVTGYRDPTPASGSINVNGSAGSVAVNFTSSTSGSNSTGATMAYIALGLVLVVVVALAVVLLMRRRTRGGPATTPAGPPSDAGGAPAEPPPPAP